MDKNVKLFKMINGEMVITEVVDVTDDNMYILSYPAVIIPTQQQGQVGFGSFMPFSTNKVEILLNPDCIAVDSEPNTQMKQTYEQWVTQIKSQESGIVMANQMPRGNVPQDGSRADFSKLNM